MSLKDIAYAATATVQVPSGEQAVRGLNLKDIMGLIGEHRSALEGAFSSIAGDTGKTEEVLGSASAMGGELLTLLPDVAAAIIAVATDEPGKEGCALAASLPAGVQLDLLEKIVEVTASTNGGLGKTIEIVLNAVGGMTNVVKGLSVLPR